MIHETRGIIEKLTNTRSQELHRCWSQMLETKCIGDNYKVLVILIIFTLHFTTIFFSLAPGTNIKKSHQHHCHRCTNLTLTGCWQAEVGKTIMAFSNVILWRP